MFRKMAALLLAVLLTLENVIPSWAGMTEQTEHGSVRTEVLEGKDSEETTAEQELQQGESVNEKEEDAQENLYEKETVKEDAGESGDSPEEEAVVSGKEDITRNESIVEEEQRQTGADGSEAEVEEQTDAAGMDGKHSADVSDNPELKTGVVTDRGSLGDINNEISWTVDSEGVFTISTSSNFADCKYIQQVDGLTEEKRNQVKTILCEGRGSSQSIGLQWHGYDASLFPNVDTLIIGKGVFAYYDNEDQYKEDSTRENTTVKRVEVLGKAHLGLHKYSALEILHVSGNMGDCFLSSCGSLQNIEVGGSVNKIRVTDCVSLKTVHIQGWKGESPHFEGDSSLESFVVEEMLSDTWKAEYGAFKNCKNLREIRIPAKLKEISGAAYQYNTSPFYGCDSLEEYPDFSHVETLGVHAFENCVNLKEADFPNLENQKLTEVFENCTSLERVSMSGPDLETISLSGSNFEGCTNLKSLEISAAVTDVGMDEFKDCTSLTEFPDFSELTSIGQNAFLNCTGLESIVVMEPIEIKKNDIFKGCTNLREVYFQDVTAWSDRAENLFEGCVSLERLVVGNMEEPAVLGRKTFRNCEKLHTLSLPAGIEGLSGDDFYGCSSLRDLPDMSNLKKIGSYGSGIFYGCSSLKEVVLPETADIAGTKREMFAGCSSLKRAVLPTSATEISEGMFSGCSSLEQVEGLEKIDTIRSKAFSGCSKLNRLDLPDTVTVLGSLPDGLEYLEIPPKIKNIKNIANLFTGEKQLKEVVIPETVTEMNGAFCDFGELGKVTFTGSRQEIPGDSFKNCRSLQEIQLPEGVQKIGASAFEGCSMMEEIQLPEGVSDIGKYAFKGCSSLGSIQIPKGVGEIQQATFADCVQLEDVRLPEGLTSVSQDAFYRCRSLKGISLPQTVTAIGQNAFAGSGLTEVLLDQPTLYVSSGAFSDSTEKITLLNQKKLELGSLKTDTEVRVGAITGAREVIIGGDQTNIGEHALSMAPGTANIYFLEGSLAFDSQSGTKGSITQPSETGTENSLSVYIDPAVTYITGKMTDCENVVIFGEPGSFAEIYANSQGYTFRESGPVGTEPSETGSIVSKKQGFDFKIVMNEAIVTGYIGRPQLADDGVLEVPEKLEGFPVTMIQRGALGGVFSGTKEIKSISLPASLKTVETRFIVSGAKNLTEITVSPSNPYLSAEGGILYNKDKTELIQVMPGITEAAIPDTVKKIHDGAFAESLVQKVIFSGGSKMEEIVQGAFRSAASLTEIVLPDTLQKIGSEAFYRCGLEDITIPAGVKEIGAGAFRGCEKLKVLNLPRMVRNIGDSAFAYSGLDILTAGEYVETIGKNILQGVSGADLYAVPGSKMEQYLMENLDPGCKYGNGTVVGEYVLGIKVEDKSDGKFMAHSELKGYRLLLSQKFYIKDFELQIMSAKNDRVLSSIQVTGNQEGDSISIPSKEMEKALPSDTEIYFKVPSGALEINGAESSEWSSKGIWSKVTMSDRWRYPNFEESVSESMLCYMVKSSGKRSMIRNGGVDGKNGTCFGMASAAAMIKQGRPGAGSFGINKEMYGISDYAYSSELSVNAKEFWQLAHLMQFDKKIEKFRKKTRNQLDDILNAVKKMLDGSGKPCILNVQYDDGWHALLPCYIDYHLTGENWIDIYVYDCNPGVNKCNSVITMVMNQNGTIANWKYYSYKGLSENASSAKNSDIDYCEIDDSFYKTIKGYRNVGDRNARNVQADSDTGENMFDQDSRLLEVATSLPYWRLSESMKLSSGSMSGNMNGNQTVGELLIPILPVSGENGTGNSRLYWLDENEAPLQVDNLPSYMQLSLAGNASSIKAGASRKSTVVMETADIQEEKTAVSITPQSKGTFTLQMDFDSEQGKNYADSLQVTGVTGKTVQVKEDAQSFILSGGQEVVIAVEKDGQKLEQEVKDGGQYEQVYITLKKDEKDDSVSMVLQGDKDGDGKPDVTITDEGDKPVVPDNPEDPDQPDNPDQPGQPDNPGNPGSSTDGQKVTGIHLSHAKAELFPTQSLTLTARTTPVSGHALTFTSTNPVVAEVSRTGVITAKAPGSTQIRVAANDGSGKTAVCTITVKAAKVKLNARKAPLQYGKSSTALKVSQMEKGDRVVSWTSSKPKIVKVSSNGKLKARAKKGKAKITVQTKFGAKATCTITVQKKKVVLKSIVVNGKEQKIRKNRATLKKGRKLTLTVSRNPITAQEKINFLSSAPRVAAVTKKGVVKAKKKGKCKITVKSSNGKKKVITVIVK